MHDNHLGTEREDDPPFRDRHPSTGLHADDDLLSAFDVDTVATEALLFQTGYLTIAKEEKDPDGVPQYRLGYPNRTRRGLNRGLLDALAPNWRPAGSGMALRR